MMSRRKGLKLIGISILFFLLLNYPLVTLWDQYSTFGGIPSLFFSLFILWGCMIVCLFFIPNNNQHSG